MSDKKKMFEQIEGKKWKDRALMSLSWKVCYLHLWQSLSIVPHPHVAMGRCHYLQVLGRKPFTFSIYFNSTNYQQITY